MRLTSGIRFEGEIGGREKEAGWGMRVAKEKNKSSVNGRLKREQTGGLDAFAALLFSFSACSFALQVWTSATRRGRTSALCEQGNDRGQQRGERAFSLSLEASKKKLTC